MNPKPQNDGQEVIREAMFDASQPREESSFLPTTSRGRQTYHKALKQEK